MARSFHPNQRGSTKDVAKMKRALSHVWNFLKDFIPLINTHGAEFLSQRHWDLFVPLKVGHDLLSLTEEELASLPLGELTNYTKPCHGNNFYLDEQDKVACKEDCLQNQGRDFVHSEENEKSMSRCFSEVEDNMSRASHYQHEDLKSVVCGAFDCHLENLGILVSCTEALGSHFTTKSIISEAMSEKKSHEVRLMSNAVAAIMGTCQSDLVVDVGSGKGYLSMELAGHHKIGVLGLDSSVINTHGAKRRKEKLTSRWSGLIARQGEKDCSQTHDVSGSSCHSQTPTISCPSCGDSLASNNDTKTADITNLYVPLTLFVDPQMNLRSVLADHALHLCDNKNPDDIKLVLAGLHTCGSLAVTAMHLFIKDPGAVGICCVGCCYQLMEEENEGGMEAICESKSDFPLSHFGKSLGIHLGRNARNLASQSVHRIQASKQLQGREFYWRALLDVLLTDLSLPVPTRIVGMRGLNRQCKTFHEYAVKAFQKLDFSSDLITREMTENLEDKYHSEQTKMAAFFQLKLVLAPVIESLILLDRLLFLAEQDCVRQACLVQLFDPLTSPRCFAIVGYKADTTIDALSNLEPTLKKLSVFPVEPT